MPCCRHIRGMQLRLLEVAVGDAACTLSGRMLAAVAKILIPDQVGMESTISTPRHSRAAAADAASKLHLLSARMSDETPLRCTARHAHSANTSAGRWDGSPCQHTISNAHQALLPCRPAHGSLSARPAGLGPQPTCRAARRALLVAVPQVCFWSPTFATGMRG